MKENRMPEITDTKKSAPDKPKAEKRKPGQDKKPEQNAELKENLKSKQGSPQAEEQKQTEETEQKKKRQSTFDEFGREVEKIATKTAESIRKVVDKALASRNTVLTIRVNDESNRKMNMLVDAGLFKSRSESAAFLIQEGIKKQNALFEKISAKLDKIEKIREELKKVVSEEFNPDKSEKK
jgi:Arc/MetJ-type ribon-helix-helix transcriptional regulator